MGNNSSSQRPTIPRETFEPEHDYLNFIQLMAESGRETLPSAIERSRQHYMKKYQGFTEVVHRFEILTPRMARLLASSSSAFNKAACQ